MEILKRARLIARRNIGRLHEPFQVVFLETVTASDRLTVFTLNKLPTRTLAYRTYRDTSHESLSAARLGGMIAAQGGATNK